MFIELTNEETGKLNLINTDDIRSVYESNSNKDNAVIIFRSGEPKLLTTESYAEVVTLIKDATEPKETYQEVTGTFQDWPSDTGVDRDDDKLPWER